MRRIFTIAALLMFTACGPLSQNQPLVNSVQGLANAGSDLWGEAPVDPRASLTREAIDAAPNDLLLFARVDEDLASVFARVSSNGGLNTWVSDGDESLSLRKGLVVATRGLGNDLMGADYSQVYPALVRGSGSAARIHDYLGGEDQIVRRTYQCEITTLRSVVIEIIQRRHDTRVVREACSGSAGSFTNLYWIDAAGEIWQSRQWVSARVGAVDIQRL
jgi:hypothetical protein